MHVKLTTSGGRRYVQLVESYRDEAGRVKKRTVATLGRAEQVDGSLDAVINGLLKITGREPMGAKPPAPTVSFESARALGNVWALTELWRSLGFSGLRRVFRRRRRTTYVEVLNRLCDPESKLGVLRWVQTARVRQLRSQVLVFARAHFQKCHYNSANCSGAAGFSIPKA